MGRYHDTLKAEKVKQLIRNWDGTSVALVEVVFPIKFGKASDMANKINGLI